jgi:hypothetical protein
MDPELLRLKGELLIALDPGAKADAEVAFCQAIDIAQRQSSKSWELRADTFGGVSVRSLSANGMDVPDWH